MGMTRQHLELVAAVLRDTHATPTTVYAMADALAAERGQAVTQHYDRSRFLAAALPDPDADPVTTVTVVESGAAFEDYDYGGGRESARVIAHGGDIKLDRGDERPLLDVNGNRCGRVERY